MRLNCVHDRLKLSQFCKSKSKRMAGQAWPLCVHAYCTMSLIHSSPGSLPRKCSNIFWNVKNLDASLPINHCIEPTTLRRRWRWCLLKSLGCSWRIAASPDKILSGMKKSTCYGIVLARYLQKTWRNGTHTQKNARNMISSALETTTRDMTFQTGQKCSWTRPGDGKPSPFFCAHDLASLYNIIIS